MAGGSRCCSGAGKLGGIGRVGVVAQPMERLAPAVPACRRGAGLSLAERVGVIEIDLPDGVRLRVDDQVSEKALRRVLAAMKAR